MALATNKNRFHRLNGQQHNTLLPLIGYGLLPAGSGGLPVYIGALMVSDVSEAAGYFRPVPDTAVTPMAADDVFGGVAAECVRIDRNTLTANGSVAIGAYTNGFWAFPVGALTVADVGKKAYASDDDTVTTTALNHLWIGYIHAVDANYVWVDIEPACKRLA